MAPRAGHESDAVFEQAVDLSGAKNVSSISEKTMQMSDGAIALLTCGLPKVRAGRFGIIVPRIKANCSAAASPWDDGDESRRVASVRRVGEGGCYVEGHRVR